MINKNNKIIQKWLVWMYYYDIMVFIRGSDMTIKAVIEIVKEMEDCKIDFGRFYVEKINGEAVYYWMVTGMGSYKKVSAFNLFNRLL